MATNLLVAMSFIENCLNKFVGQLIFVILDPSNILIIDIAKSGVAEYHSGKNALREVVVFNLKSRLKATRKIKVFTGFLGVDTDS